MAKKAETITTIKGRSVRFNVDAEGNTLASGVVSVDVVTDGPGGTLRSSEQFAFESEPPTDEAIRAEIEAR